MPHGVPYVKQIFEDEPLETTAANAAAWNHQEAALVDLDSRINILESGEGGGGVGGISPTAFTAKGDILVGTGVGTFQAQNVGGPSQNLITNPTQPDGVEWVSPAANVTIISADGSGTLWKLIVAADNTVLAVPATTNFPFAPTGLILNIHLSFVKVNWNVVPDATTYRVYRDGVLLGTTSNLKYNDGSVVVGSTYVYSIRAVNVYGMVSPFSTTASATISGALNVTPVFDSITVWPANPSPSDTVYVHINAHDVDSQDLTFTLTTTVGTLTVMPTDPSTYIWSGS